MEEEEGKRSGIETATATLMEYENKKQCGAEICGVVVAVLHDRDSRERKRDRERESVCCVLISTNLLVTCWLQISFTNTNYGLSKVTRQYYFDLITKSICLFYLLY